MKRITFLFFLLSGKILLAQDLDTFLDNWHLAAANANSSGFFDKISDDGIYIGTDATERWSKEEFISFGKPYFDRGSAWDFKPYDRKIVTDESGDIVWFSELLTTWMGICRGSGILKKSQGEWKIEQYHLSVTVPNGVIKGFISLIEDYEQTQSKNEDK